MLADETEVTGSISRLRNLTQGGDYTYYVDIAHYMADRPLGTPPSARWIDDEQAVRSRWSALATTRREHLRTTR
ncbi:hypothetical protein LRS74_33015 [Streptomyces sp. LX-29]|uniref:hypothetical protein n=1 Tax=Streptomyces sp. LX-29 TaxID=2900152 RepID=UPI00240E92B2|nr:hypothetical protein [Streptomyces sp. LX-29]WFB11322.1 hypothetical protein LRS74_33015 [Streptomyces sp. LX-29]